jgi:hypothetical protein
VRAFAAEHLLPGEGDDVELPKSSFCAKAAEVASQMVRPLRSAGMKSPLATRTPEVVPFQVKTTSRSKSTLPRGRAARRRAPRTCARRSSFSCLTTSVTQPCAEALPGDHVDAAFAEQRPQRHLDGAGVGGRNDADAVVGRDLENFAGQRDGLLELGLADLGAVRAAERRVRRASSDQPGRFAQGPEEKLGFAGRSPGLATIVIVVLSFQIVGPSLGRGGPRTAICV